MSLISQFKKQLVNGSFVSTLIASLSLLCLMEYAHLYGPGPFIKQMLSGYRDAVDFLLSPFEQKIKELLANLAIWFTWFPKLNLLPHWKYIFVPLWLYVSRDGIISWQRNRVLGAVVFLMGTIIFIIASVAAGTERLDDPLRLVAFWPIAGFTFYDLFDTWLASTFRRPPNQTWIETFKYYFSRFPLPSVLIGGALLFIGASYKFDHVAILLVFIVAMAVRNIVVSVLLATRLQKRDKTKTWWEHFRPLQTKRLGLVLLKTVGYAIVIIAIDKGKELGQEVAAAAGQNVMIALFAAALMATLLTSLYRWRKRRVT